MASALVKLKPQHVVTALAMAGLETTEQQAGIIQDVIHCLIDKKTDFSVDDAVEITVKNAEKDKDKETMEVKILKLKERYKTLSELYDPKSKSKTQLKIGHEMEVIMLKLPTLIAKSNGT